MKIVELYPLCNMKVLLCLLQLQTCLSCWLGLHLQYTKSCNLRFPYFSPIWKWELVGERKGLVFCVHSARHEVKTDIFHGNDNMCFNNSQCDNFLQKCLICTLHLILIQVEMKESSIFHVKDKHFTVDIVLYSSKCK